jgi:POT family proton-dependent oligopeptide transporter
MLKQHPKGLMNLFFTEMWERFGFYTIMAIFTLYMDEDFFWDDARKGNIYGLFLAAVYFFPIFGGWIADKKLGAKRTIRIGAVTLFFGYSLLALSSLDRLYLFYTSLVIIALGSGLFKANISVLVGNLYEPESKLRDIGFNIFYMGINIGAAIAPIAATILRNYYNFNICFAAAALGMLVSVFIFQRGKEINDTSTPTRLFQKNNLPLDRDGLNKKEDKERIVALGILFAIAVFFWMAFYQNGFALTLFAKRSTVIYSILKPETYQFFGAFFIVVLTPVLVYIFNKLRQKGSEPSSPTKIFIGMFIAGFSLLIMVIASLAGGNEDLNIMSPSWLISTYFVVTIAELFVSPIALSFTTKVAPQRIQGLMMGCWFAATATGAYASGLFGSLYSKLPHHIYFIILAFILFLAALFVLLFIKRLKRFAV